MKFFAENLPGSESIGSVTEGSHMDERLKQAQACINAILSDPTNRNKTGEDLGLLVTPGVMCSSPQQLVMVNSNVLTPRDLKSVKTIRANGPAEFAMIYMIRQTKDGGVW